MIGQAFWEIWLSGDLLGLMALWILMLPLVLACVLVAWIVEKVRGE